MSAPTLNLCRSKRWVGMKCLHAWNACRKGETTNLNYYAKADVPSVSK